jgi:hypothetical protein
MMLFGLFMFHMESMGSDNRWIFNRFFTGAARHSPIVALYTSYYMSSSSSVGNRYLNSEQHREFWIVVWSIISNPNVDILGSLNLNLNGSAHGGYDDAGQFEIVANRTMQTLTELWGSNSASATKFSAMGAGKWGVGVGTLVGMWQVQAYIDLGMDMQAALYIQSIMAYFTSLSQHESKPPSIDICSSYYSAALVNTAGAAGGAASDAASAATLAVLEARAADATDASSHSNINTSITGTDQIAPTEISVEFSVAELLNVVQGEYQHQIDFTTKLRWRDDRIKWALSRQQEIAQAMNAGMGMDSRSNSVKCDLPCLFSDVCCERFWRPSWSSQNLAERVFVRLESCTAYEDGRARRGSLI